MKILSNCINDEIRTWYNCGLMMVWGLIIIYLWCFYDFPIKLRFLLIFMDMQIR